MEFKYREKFLVEKCINSITHTYLDNKDYHSALQDYQIEFCSFLAQNEKQYVDYGINYLCEHYPNEAQLLTPLILEYKTNGTSDSLSWDPIPENCTTKGMTNPIYPEDTQCNYSEEEEVLKTYEIDTKNCGVRQKIVLFVMKVLGF